MWSKKQYSTSTQNRGNISPAKNARVRDIYLSPPWKENTKGHGQVMYIYVNLALAASVAGLAQIGLCNFWPNL
jgi:hypothetical protein